MSTSRIINAGELPPGHRIEADLCIVGAGAAGIAMAHELAGTSLDVCVIEGGLEQYSRRAQELYSGYNTGLPNHELTLSRFRVLGGSTTRWTGQCAPLNAEDFEERPWVPDSGWPMTLEDLDPWYERAHSMLGLGPYEYDPGLASRPRAPLDAAEIEEKLFHFCRETDFRPLHRSIGARGANVTTWINSNVVEIQLDSTRSTVGGLVSKTLDGRTHRIEARAYVLATGGIENSRLLLASDVGNEHDLVGRYFMDHPYVFSGVFDPSDPSRATDRHTLESYEDLSLSAWQVATLQFTPELLAREELVNVGVNFIRRPIYKMTPSYRSSGVRAMNALREAAGTGLFVGPRWSKQLGGALRGLPDIARSVFERVRLGEQTQLALRSTIENVPRHSSRIRLAQDRDRLGVPRAEVDWRLGDLEWRSLQRFHERLVQAFEEAGLGKITCYLERDEFGWPSTLIGGKHHMGGTRMHRDPEKGVVDPDGCVHGLDNLFVAGSSVFPACGYANPTLTIVALAIRLAEHIRERLRQ